jgi:hypothetical protein
MNKIYLRLGVFTGVVDALATTTKYKSRLLAAWCLIAFTSTALGDVTILQEPTGANVRSGSRARFSIDATSSLTNVYYQWFSNGVFLPNADKSTYVTPVLSTNDTGNVYLVEVSDAGGWTNLSAPGYLWVGPASAPRVQPYIGVNFLSADVASVGNDAAGFLRTTDVAGVVEQENFVNLSQTIAKGVPLADSHGAATPVTLSYGTVLQGPTGIGASDADHALFQGLIQNSNSPITLTFSNVPPTTNYSLLVYSVGISNGATYNESFALVGQSAYPTLHVRAQDAGQYLASPAYKQMSSTDPNNRDLGNYVQFDNVSPAADGTLVLVITPESNILGPTNHAPVNAVQLATVKPAPVRPMLSTSYLAASHQLTISWDTNAVGYALESSPVLGPNASWAPIAGVATPITNANSVTVSTTSSSHGYVTMIQKGFPFIIQQPQSQNVQQFTTNVSFSVIATGAPPLTYQWKFNGVNITNATNSTYTIPTPVDFTNVGDYVVTVIDDKIDSLPAGLAVYSLNGNFGTQSYPISYFYAPKNGTFTCPPGTSGLGPFDRQYVPRNTSSPYNTYYFYGPNTQDQTGPFVNSTASTHLTLDSQGNSPPSAVELQNGLFVFVCTRAQTTYNFPGVGVYSASVFYHGPPYPPDSGQITFHWSY